MHHYTHVHETLLELQRHVSGNERLPVNSSHDKLVTWSTCHSQLVTQPTRYTVNSSQFSGELVTQPDLNPAL